MKNLLVFWTALTALTSTCFAQELPQLDLPRVALTLGFHRIEAQVAQTAQQRAAGLMFRTEMAQHEGMLFVFSESGQQCFWMKNTLIPLTAAFVADDGTVVNLENMQPQTTAPHCSAQPVRYVLEMNRGWFEKRRIKAGARIAGLPVQAR